MASKGSKGKKGTQRKLTAILCADVVGYSRLMGADEEATIETLTAYRKVFLSHIESHQGRVVDAKGDAILAEFASVVDAVNGAVEIQRGLAEKNAELPDDRRMDFRIGVNLGDVVLKDEVIYGDGVNVAARVEALAEAGGICISGSVYAQVRNKLDLAYEFLGKKEVKNIAEPVPVYRIGMEDGAEQVKEPEQRVSATSVIPGGLSLELPDRPSIAVLPFVNMSNDPEQEYFSDGITEDIITDLSKLPRLFVIARNSSFQYKGQHVDLRKVGEELGVKSVLEGSVRKAGQRVRITAQLVDTTSGEHLWAQRYDRELQDVFALQDEITLKIATELEVKLVSGEQARAWKRSTSNLEAYDTALRGRELVWSFKKADSVRARHMFEKALELDPGFAYAMVLLGWTYVREVVNFGRRESPEACFDQAIELGNRALAIADYLGDACTLLSQAYRNKGEHERALEYGKQAVTLNPDDADSNAWYSLVLSRTGSGEEAVERIETAIRLNPYPPDWYLRALGAAYCAVGRFEDAVAVSRECVGRNPNDFVAHFRLTISCMLAGMEEQGRAQALHMLRIDPGFSASSHRLVTTYKDQTEREHYITLLRKAGLPE